jgi:transposase-like protein
MGMQCRKTLDDQDLRLIEAKTKKLALARYAEGRVARKIERLVGVSHHTVLGGVRKEVQGKALQPVP